MKQKIRYTGMVWSIVGFLCLYSLDRLLKMVCRLGDGSDWSPFFDFSFHPNPFLAFSIPFLSPLFTMWVMLLCVILFSIMGARWCQRGFFLSGFSSFLIVLGALSNLYDRFMYGYVIDYISLLPNLGLPYFNIADVMIVLGILGLVFQKQKS